MPNLNLWSTNGSADGPRVCARPVHSDAIISAGNSRKRGLFALDKRLPGPKITAQAKNSFPSGEPVIGQFFDDDFSKRR